ncbi:MAG: Imm5 family immunity protein [Chloroflexota bacterium]|nr:Imm5 family immunity protein [Chloroflexota bacterium]
MPLSKPLEHVLRLATAALAQHPHHDLNIGYRHAIYHVLGLPRDRPHGPMTIGQKRRIHLALMTVRQVLPRWEALHPTDRRPHRLLHATEALLLGTTADLDDILPDFFDLFYADTAGDEIGLAATWALHVARADNEWTPTHINYDLNDSQLSGPEHDTAFFAAIAYTAGPWWTADSSRTKRFEFWTWWLTHAVPTAWHAVS